MGRFEGRIEMDNKIKIIIYVYHDMASEPLEVSSEITEEQKHELSLLKELVLPLCEHNRVSGELFCEVNYELNGEYYDSDETNIIVSDDYTTIEVIE